MAGELGRDLHLGEGGGDRDGNRNGGSVKMNPANGNSNRNNEPSSTPVQDSNQTTLTQAVQAARPPATTAPPPVEEASPINVAVAASTPSPAAPAPAAASGQPQAGSATVISASSPAAVIPGASITSEPNSVAGANTAQSSILAETSAPGKPSGSILLIALEPTDSTVSIPFTRGSSPSTLTTEVPDLGSSGGSVSPGSASSKPGPTAAIAGAIFGVIAAVSIITLLFMYRRSKALAPLMGCVGRQRRQSQDWASEQAVWMEKGSITDTDSECSSLHRTRSPSPPLDVVQGHGTTAAKPAAKPPPTLMRPRHAAALRPGPASERSQPVLLPSHPTSFASRQRRIQTGEAPTRGFAPPPLRLGDAPPSWPLLQQPLASSGGRSITSTTSCSKDTSTLAQQMPYLSPHFPRPLMPLENPADTSDMEKRHIQQSDWFGALSIADKDS